jgi:hypothetical protein
MADLQSNLAKLAESRKLTRARRSRIQSSLSDFLATRVESTPIPVGVTGVTPEAVTRRLSVGKEAPISGGFDPGFQSALERMIKDSGGRLSVKSGYRTPERQAQLYAEAVKKYGKNARKWVAPPGKSNHNKGLAADLGFSNSEAISWAHQNAAKYGLKFPLANENWHVEPAGIR